MSPICWCPAGVSVKTDHYDGTVFSSVSVSGGCFDQWVSGVCVRGDGRGCDSGGTDQDCLGRRELQCGAERTTAVYDSGRNQRTVSGDRSVGDQIPGEPGILVARIEDRFYIDTSVVNNLILGITRSGKGELLAKQV